MRTLRCPRCKGLLFWPYLHCLPWEKDLYKDKLKCFSCARVFTCVPLGDSTFTLQQYPARNEKIENVIIRIKEDHND